MKFVLLLVSLVVLSLLATPSWCLNFSYPTFQDDDTNDFIRRNSYIVHNAIQVTPDMKGASISNYSGRIFYSKPLKLWRNGIVASFTSTFVINITPEIDPGGEGLAFLLAGDTALPDNSYGKWLGIVNASTNGSAQYPVVAVEFDTSKSHDQDIDSNHVGLDINSIYSIKQVSLSSFGVNLSTSTDITATVRYDGQIISVFVHLSNDTAMTPVVSVPIGLADHLPENVYVGFSGSTSIGTELNCIKAWWFESDDIGNGPNLLWVWILVPVSFVLAVLVALYLFHQKTRNSGDRIEDLYPRIEDQIKGSNMAPVKFRLGQLRVATGNFSCKNMLGEGGFGTVYKGRVLNRDVAVKRISKDSRQGVSEFLSEVTIIGSLHHRNLVKLIGWCKDRQELLLVYEYMPNGSLEKLIHNQDDKLVKRNSTLNREKRYNIISGVAQALDYLHNGCERRVLHRDIKASNIMLDSDFNARLGDFGLARMMRPTELTHHSTKEIAGTPGYMAPESFLTGRATAETDVYAFGVLMFAILCGRRPGDQSEESNIVYWIWELHRQGRITSAVDSKLDGDSEETECVLLLGLACCHPNPHQRPSMRTVLQVLSGEAPVPEVPNERPPFMWPAMPPSFKRDQDTSMTDRNFAPITELIGR